MLNSIEEIISINHRYAVDDQSLVINTNCIKGNDARSIVFKNITNVTMLDNGMLRLSVDGWCYNDHRTVVRMFNKAMNSPHIADIELPETISIIRSSRINAFNEWKSNKRRNYERI